MNTRDAQAHGAGAGPDADALRRRDDRTAREALDQSRHRARDRSRAARYAAAALCFAAELAHLSVLPHYYLEWWGYGLFFLLVAMFQGTLGAALLFWPQRRLLGLGLWDAVAVIVVYVVTHTLGVPVALSFLPQSVGPLDLTVTVMEVALVALLVALRRGAAS